MYTLLSLIFISTIMVATGCLSLSMTNPNVIASGCIIGVFATILFVCVVLIITHDVKKSRK